MAGADIVVMQRACALIDDLGAQLDRQLSGEQRPSERLRMLRETTNRITRTANDAIQAYARGRRTVDTQLERHGTADDAIAARAALQSARRDILRALEAARHRYPWADDDAEQLGDDAGSS